MGCGVGYPAGEARGEAYAPQLGLEVGHALHSLGSRWDMNSTLRLGWAAGWGGLGWGAC